MKRFYHRVRLLFTDMKVTSKVIIGFAIAILVAIAIGIYCFLNLYQISSNTQIFYEQTYRQSNSVGALKDAMTRIRMQLVKGIAVKDKINSKDAVTQTNKAAEVMHAELDYLSGSFRASNEMQMLDQLNKIQQHLDESDDIRLNIQDLILSDSKPTALAAYLSYYEPSFGIVERGIQSLQEYANTKAVGFAEQAAQINAQTRLVIALMLLIGLLLALFVTLAISRGIREPIHEIVKVTQQMSRGKLGIEIRYRSKNEFGQLADALATTVHALQSYIGNIAEKLGTMATGDMAVTFDIDYMGDFAQIRTSMIQIADSLNHMLVQISQTSDQIGSGAEHLSLSAQALSKGAAEQASSVEELFATVDDIAQQVSVNAKNARRAQEITLEASKTIERENTQMTAMALAMERIDTASQKISRIIKTIDEIAFQTNILALNAAIEAARAGEAGKGFGVVADEVRNLAGKSAEAAKDTADLIENTIQAVRQGMKIASDMAGFLSEIVEGARQSTDLVTAISLSSSQQANEISQIREAISRISMVVQTNSTTAEESAAASEELTRQAELLKRFLSGFHLNLNEAVENS